MDPNLLPLMLQQAAPASPAAQASRLPDLPQVPGTPVVVGADGQVVIGGQSSPAALYDAARNQRSELRDQLGDLRSERRSVLREMQQNSSGPERSGLEQRLAQVDQRIASVDKQLADADAAVAKLAAVPGAIVPTPPVRQSGPPEEFWVVAGLILVPSAFILSIGYARRLWRKGAATVAAIPQEFLDRFARVEQALDSVAIEVERIGEGQRYLTRALAERQLGPGAAQPIEVRQREGEKVGRDK